jgi:cell division protein FtsL
MAACTTTYLGENCGWPVQVAEWNRKYFERQQSRRRGARTPEFHFPKHFDNSRLVKEPDPARTHQMRLFSAAIAVLFSLVMIYGLQHFSAIEGGYRVETEKQMRDKLREENRQLRLSEAQLTEPGRIDSMARQLGLAEPQPGQVVHPNSRLDASAPAIAQAAPPAFAGQ